MGSSSYTDNKLIDHLLGSGTYTKPSSLELALYIGDPAQGGVEVDGTDYARQTITFTIDGGTAENNTSIEFPQATEEWGVVTHIVVFDESGNNLVSAELTDSLDIGVGDIPRFASGGISVTLD